MRSDRSDEPQATQAAEEEVREAGGDSAAPEESAAAGGAGQGEMDALRDRHLRLAAEYDNYRKRTERERAESWTRAQAQLVEKLLDSLDDLQRVAHFSAETTSLPALLEGVQMVERKIMRVLESAGLEVVDAAGQPFDPGIHEALMTAPAERREEDETVGQVFQSGYRFKGDLLRPARVQVRKYEG